MKFYFYLVNVKSQEPLWVDFHQTWYMDAPPGVDELIRFGRDSPKVKGQLTWSK